MEELKAQLDQQFSFNGRKNVLCGDERSALGFSPATLAYLKAKRHDPWLKGKLEVEQVAYSGGTTVFRKDQPMKLNCASSCTCEPVTRESRLRFRAPSLPDEQAVPAQ